MKTNKTNIILATTYVVTLVLGILLGVWITSAESGGHDHGGETEEVHDEHAHEEEVHEEGGVSAFSDEYMSLLTDPAHFFYELTLNIGMDVLLIGIALPFLVKAVKRHDEEHHEGHVSEPGD